ncbi:MAG: response regulator [Thermodesulfobacteriota bacterium]
MPILTVFHGTFCQEEAVIQNIQETTGYQLVTDQDLAAEAARISDMDAAKIMEAFASKTSIFNKFTHEKERSIAYLRLALAEMLPREDLLITGFSSHLIPREIAHALWICIIADMPFRVKTAMETRGCSEKEAIQLIHEQDKDRSGWVNILFKITDPWDPSLYDVLVPTDKMGVDEITALVSENLRSEAIQPTAGARKAAEDFVLAAKVEVALAGEGHNVEVKARDGAVTLTTNKNVLMLSRLEEELRSIAEKVEGVRSVETKVGKGYPQADIYRKYDFELPSRVLLVDDEREFVQTLSERLLMRDMGSAVAYDGESALEMVREEEPEVMILDLKMPGIDGIEVLRQVKETRPEIEVIILTGHGSEADREVCMNLGAFAYLHKPVDIEILSENLRLANEKIRNKKADTR